MRYESLRKEVLETARSLRKFGLVWMAGGTVIAREVQSGHVIVTPSGMDYDDLTPEDMNVIDLDLNLVEGKYRPSCASNLWTAILRARPDVNAIIHAHSPYATAFSVINESIPIITETQADWFNRPIQVAPYAHIEDDCFSTAPVDALGEGFAVLLGQHGPIIVGENLKYALERAVTLEEAARTYAIAKSIGTPLVFSQEQIDRSYEYYHHRYGQVKP